jgi:hypothetical protein
MLAKILKYTEPLPHSNKYFSVSGDLKAPVG